MTSVGYRNVVITAAPGRIVAVLLMLVSIGFVVTLAATIASTFVAQDEQSAADVFALTPQRVDDRLQRIEDALR